MKKISISIVLIFFSLTQAYAFNPLVVCSGSTVVSGGGSCATQSAGPGDLSTGSNYDALGLDTGQSFSFASAETIYSIKFNFDVNSTDTIHFYFDDDDNPSESPISSGSAEISATGDYEWVFSSPYAASGSTTYYVQCIEEGSGDVRWVYSSGVSTEATGTRLRDSDANGTLDTPSADDDMRFSVMICND